MLDIMAPPVPPLMVMFSRRPMGSKEPPNAFVANSDGGVTAMAAAVSGGVHVVGTVAGSADFRRVATPEHVWLTVGK